VAYPSRHAQIAQIAFREDRLVLICPPDHSFAKGVAVPLKRVDGQPFIAFDPSTPTGRVIERALRSAGVAVRVVHRFDNVETIKRAVEISSGIAIVPNSTIREEVRSRNLEAVTLSGSGWSRPLAILHKKGRRPSAPALKFIEILQKEM
ncbi:MAG: LysR family transcriptional regulator substrate-binding protein, partial [Candidatus Eisenbacteria bacterium]